MTIDKVRGTAPVAGTLVLALHAMGAPQLSLDEPDFDTDTHNDAGDDPPAELDADAAATCAGLPIVLANALASPRGLVLDDHAAYVLARPLGAGPEGQLLEIDRRSGVVTVLATTHRATLLTGDEAFLYWTELEANKVRRVSKLGHSAATLGSERPAPRQLAVGAGGALVWTAGAYVLRARVDGRGNDELAHLDAPATGLVIDGGDALVSVDSGALWCIPMHVGAAPKRLTSACFTHGLVTDGVHVYWLDTAGATISRAARAGGVAQVIASVPSGRGFVTLSADHVIWTDNEAGLIRRLAKTGGAVETLASAMPLPAEVAAFEGWVAWVNRGDGSVVALRR